ncbi:MAG: transposase [Bryobacterales bacterium]|nr:transposase [Bryobacterales bacterium]
MRAGELVLADAGYCNPPGIAAVVAKRADVCVRLNRSALPLTDHQERPFPLLRKIRTVRQAGETADWYVWTRAGSQLIPGRLCAIRKSEVAVAQAHRRLRRKEVQGKSRMTPEAREYACYVLVFTTLTRKQASTRQVLESYRLRWQIEITFKRLKQVVQLGHVPKLDDQSSRAWLYGKLFVALLSQKLALVGSTVSPWGYYLLDEAPDAQPMA